MPLLTWDQCTMVDCECRLQAATRLRPRFGLRQLTGEVFVRAARRVLGPTPGLTTLAERNHRTAILRELRRHLRDGHIDGCPWHIARELIQRAAVRRLHADEIDQGLTSASSADASEWVRGPAAAAAGPRLVTGGYRGGA